MSARRVDVDRRMPVEGAACWDCGYRFRAGQRPPYERIVRLTVDYGGALRVVSQNLCRTCWLIYVWQSKDELDHTFDRDFGGPAPGGA